MSIFCRGVRGATTASANTPEAILEATRELLVTLIEGNGLRPEDVASVFFTTTPDLNAAFPARAARDLGWLDVALLGAQEMEVPGAPPRCIRVLIHWNTSLPQAAIRHAYLRDAASLRPERGAPSLEP
jgi:chorismate mutase